MLPVAAMLAALCISSAHAQDEPAPLVPEPTPAAPPAPEPEPVTRPNPSGPGTITTQPDGTTVIRPSSATDRQRAPDMRDARTINLDCTECSLFELITLFADQMRMNYVIGDRKELEAKKVTIISHKDVPVGAAYEAFLSALAVSGYTTTTSNNTTKIVKAGEAGTTPIPIRTGVPGRGDDGYVTQLIQLENTSVADMSKVIQTLAPPDAKIIAYPPTNTMIVTDTAVNIRKIYKLMKELDVAAPKSTLEIIPLSFAQATEIKAIIESLYGTAQTQDPAEDPRSARARARARRTQRNRQPEQPSEAVSAGKESQFISKVLDDERTNSVIVLANEQGHEAVRGIIAELDVDVDPQNRAQIHVVYLEHAKAEDVASVLSELSQQGNEPQRGAANARNQRNQNQRDARTGRVTPPAAGGDGDAETKGAIAAFDSGMRIAADENTNSLVIIANQEDFRVVQTVISKLDIERKQVFVDAVILELSSEDTMDFGLAAHMPAQPDENSVGFVGGQFNSSSLGLTQDILSGLAVGVFGETVDVPSADGTTLPIPAFGIVMNALKTNSAVNIISNPSLHTLDNQEAKIVVGRRIPFPTTSGLNNLGQPVVSFQREDVAVTLEVTPRINSSNYVTLELGIEVQEIEEDDAGLNVAQSGPITSKRELETVALVRDNQTVVLGGLVGTTDTEVESKLPVLGDLPVLGVLFRGSRQVERKTNLMLFLTPHIVDDEDDMWEIQRVKEAQRQEFLRRFYGKSRDKYMEEVRKLLRYSMNYVDQPSMFRGPSEVSQDLRVDGQPLSDETRAAIDEELQAAGRVEPGSDAGTLPEEDTAPLDIDFGDELPEEVPLEGPQPDAPPVEEVP